LDLLPRRCPVCREHTIIGHGRRSRQAHDDRRDRIWVRRGFCPPCNKTFTVLPDWLVSSAPFSLRCRQQACERIAAGDSVEQRLSRTRCLCGPSEPTEPETTDFPSPLREAAVTFLHLIAPRTQRFSHVESQTTESRRAGGISISSARFPHTAPGCRRKLGFGNARK